MMTLLKAKKKNEKELICKLVGIRGSCLSSVSPWSIASGEELTVEPSIKLIVYILFLLIALGR